MSARERAILTAVLASLATLTVVASINAYLHRNDPPPPCSYWAEQQREHVPARCFGDFHPERP